MRRKATSLPVKSQKKTTARKTGRPTEEGSLRSTLAKIQKWPTFKEATLKQVREWTAKGYDFSSEEALVSCLQNQQRVSENIDLPPDEIRSQTAIEKLLKLRAERKTKEMELETMSGEYIHISRHNQIVTRLALRARAAAQRIITEPPNWSGLKPEDLSKRGRVIFDGISRELENAGTY